MKIFKFIISKIFLRKAILGICVMLLLCMANYITFTAARSILSTFQGYQETKYVNQEGVYIANLDPDSHIDMGIVGENGIQAVYDYLNSNFKYAFYTDGFIISVPNSEDMEISLCYINEQYYRLNGFELSQGTDLYFDYPLEGEIPVLIGKGLSKTYPVGSTIKIEKSVLGRPLTLKVQGVLKQNAYHSNYYALNSKTYYNFSILFPVNEDFINHANMDIQFNGLMDITLLDTSKEEIENLSEIIKDNLGLRFNFFSQEENYDYFNERIGFVLQESALINSLTIEDNIKLPFLYAGSEKMDLSETENFEAVVSAIGIKPILKKKPLECSGGERARTVFARGIIMNPQIILADEPTASLDRENRERIVTLLFRMNTEFNTTIITVTHDLEIANRHDRVIHLERRK